MIIGYVVMILQHGVGWGLVQHCLGSCMIRYAYDHVIGD